MYNEGSTQCNGISTEYNGISTEYNEESTAYKDISTEYNGISTKYNELITEYNNITTKYNDISTQYNRNHYHKTVLAFHTFLCQKVCQRWEAKGFCNSLIQQVSRVHRSLLLSIPHGFFFCCRFILICLCLKCGAKTS